MTLERKMALIDDLLTRIAASRTEASDLAIGIADNRPAYDKLTDVALLLIQAQNKLTAIKEMVKEDNTQAGTPTWEVPELIKVGTYLGSRQDEENDDLYDWYFNPRGRMYRAFYGHNTHYAFRHSDHEETPQTDAAEMAQWARNRAKELGLV